MFDLGFFELALIFIVALVVLGPDKLPSAARTVGRYVGRARRMLNEVKADIKREIDQEELRKIRAIGDDLKAVQREVGEVGRKVAGAAEGELGGEVQTGSRSKPGSNARSNAGADLSGADVPGAAGDVGPDGAAASAPNPAPASAAGTTVDNTAATTGEGEAAGPSADRPRRPDTTE